MLVIELLTLGSLSYFGSRFVKQHKEKKAALKTRGVLTEKETPPPPPPPEQMVVSPQRVKRDLRLSGAALGLSTSGMLLGMPFLSVMSLPGLVCVALPTFRAALYELRQGRIDSDSNTSIRLLFCLVTGLYGLAALDLTLQMAVRRQVAQTGHDFDDRLAVLLGQPTDTVWVARDGAELEVPLYQVDNGTTIILKAGDTVPCPGVVVKGSGRVRPLLDTDSAGEPVDPDAFLSAGYIVTQGNLEVTLQRFGTVLPDIRQELKQAALGKTELVKMSMEGGSRMAPWMTGIFLAGLPFIGFARSAVFLTTRLGTQMQDAGTQNARQVIMAGLDHGLFIREITALERANMVNAIVFDAALLTHPGAKGLTYPLMASLRQRQWTKPLGLGMPKPFALYVIADDEETGQHLRDTLGLDDYFNEPLSFGRARLLGSLQQAGRQVCHVGLPGQDDPILKEIALSVTWCPDGVIQSSTASILLGRDHLRDLATLFDLAQAFASRQGSSLLMPLGIDLLNLSTSLLFNYGLLYSIVLSNAVTLMNVSGSGYVKREPLNGSAADTPPPT